MYKNQTPKEEAELQDLESPAPKVPPREFPAPEANEAEVPPEVPPWEVQAPEEPSPEVQEGKLPAPEAPRPDVPPAVPPRAPPIRNVKDTSHLFPGNPHTQKSQNKFLF